MVVSKVVSCSLVVRKHARSARRPQSSVSQAALKMCAQTLPLGARSAVNQSLRGVSSQSGLYRP
jgi:hypothetical protein